MERPSAQRVNGIGMRVMRTVENGCASVAVPLISSGIFGYPKEAAWRVAISTCVAKLDELGGDGPDIVFCVKSDSSLELGRRMLSEIRGHEH